MARWDWDFGKSPEFLSQKIYFTGTIIGLNCASLLKTNAVTTLHVVAAVVSPAMNEESQPITSEEVATLYAEHGEPIRRFLWGVLRDDALVADCLQATFAKLLLKGHLTNPQSRRSWLFTVAYQEAMLAKRNSSTTDRILRKACWSKDLHDSAEPAEALLRGEAIERMQAALQTLSHEQRVVVRMRIYEDKTFAVIAAELQIPLSTALARMRSALIKLRAQFEP
jgi:RNA polymerase sigma-70 factor (ECF subfamily)